VNDDVREIVVVDYGLGNLYSVQRALSHVGASSRITSDAFELEGAAGIVLPGVGAFGDAIERLNATGLASALRDYAASGRPVLGVCLGMQLLFSASHEFGLHPGLDLISGSVERLSTQGENGRVVKVPHVGWNTVRAVRIEGWEGTPLEGLPSEVPQYFVHSYRAVPLDPATVLGVTEYGGENFCSSIAAANVFGCQFHPELSGPGGLRIYQNFAMIAGAQAAGSKAL
jgi:glutamine amidotransferase